MTAQERFEEMVREHVWPFLRAQGFKRTKATFHRPVDANWQVVNLQRSKWSDRSSVDFTVNLAVGIDSLREGLHDWGQGKRPPETRCQLRQRLGVLLRGDDVWWEVGHLTRVGALGDTINTALETCGLPWLEARSTDAALLKLMRSRDAMRSEPIHHLYWLERLAVQLGEAQLARAVRAERDQKEAALDAARRLEAESNG